MSRKIKIQMIGEGMKYFNGISSGHLNRSKLFKPELSLIVPENALCSLQEFEENLRRIHKTKEDIYINFHVISDGRTAYIKRV